MNCNATRVQVTASLKMGASLQIIYTAYFTSILYVTADFVVVVVAIVVVLVLERESLSLSFFVRVAR